MTIVYKDHRSTYSDTEIERGMQLGRIKNIHHGLHIAVLSLLYPADADIKIKNNRAIIKIKL
jgi:hypothetical protein